MSDFDIELYNTYNDINILNINNEILMDILNIPADICNLILTYIGCSINEYFSKFVIPFINCIKTDFLKRIAYDDRQICSNCLIINNDNVLNNYLNELYSHKSIILNTLCWRHSKNSYKNSCIRIVPTYIYEMKRRNLYFETIKRELTGIHSLMKLRLFDNINDMTIYNRIKLSISVEINEIFYIYDSLHMLETIRNTNFELS